MAKEIIRVERGEFKITDNPNQSLYTDGLDSCVGLALIENRGEKRGLGHVYYDGTTGFDLKGQDGFLDEFLSMLSNPDAYITYLRHKLDENSGYENFMANHIYEYLRKMNIKLKVSDGQTEFNKKGIHYKDMAVHNDKLYIIYRGLTEIY